MDTAIILASNSPRRKELLRQIGVAFTTQVADVDERILAGEMPETYTMRVAANKAKAVKHLATAGTIIAADTVVVLDDMILGKPADGHDAERMLTLLSGRMHRVITGLAVIDVGTENIKTDNAVTCVWFRTLTQNQIRSYVNTKEPLDKAGAYGIQGKGALLVERIDGCYFNVVGLPLSLLGKMLMNFGIKLY